ELGYEPFPLGRLDEFGATTFTTMQLLVASNGVVVVADLLELLVDLDGRSAYLEFRALHPDGRPIAVSRWIELAWSPELLAAVLSGR
ncbi:MAG: hypothetical protein L0206_19355, partial [Actinobacteria bacterium]|nr:hypothetical protein [Actinomycetota bacterium]